MVFYAMHGPLLSKSPSPFLFFLFFLRYVIMCGFDFGGSSAPVMYPHLSEVEFAKECPVCHNICNCKACLHMKRVAKPPEEKIKKDNRVQCNCCILHFLLPWLKELRQEAEKEIEANIRVTIAEPISLIFTEAALVVPTTYAFVAAGSFQRVAYLVVMG